MKKLILLLTVSTFLYSCKSNPEEKVRYMYLWRYFRRSHSSILCQDVG